MEAKSVTHENTPDKMGESVRGVLDSAFNRLTTIKKSNMARKLTGLPGSIKNGFADNVVRRTKQTKDYINSVKEKNARMKSLEMLLKIEDDEVVSSGKKNIIYRSGTGRLTIVDKDFWGEPVSVTIKDENSVSVMIIKFSSDKLFLYPSFNEKSIKGEVFFLDENEIWYKDEDTITVLVFGREKHEALKFRLQKRHLSGREAIMSHVRTSMAIQKDRRISALLKEKGIDPEKVLKLGQNYILVQSAENNFTAYLSGETGEFSETAELCKLPKLSDQGFASLFSYDICSYALKNGYDLGQFIQNGEFIEYWQEIGSKKVCLLRYKC